MDQLDIHALVVLFVVGAAAQAVLAWRRRERIRALIDAGPAQRARFYVRLTVVWSLAAALVALLVVASPDVSAADVGWAWPRHDAEANLPAWGLAAAWLLGLVLGTLFRLARRGRGMVPLPSHPVVPRSRRELPLAAIALLCTSSGEEVVFRGLFIGAITQLYHAPVVLAAAVSLALFVAGHANQGRAMIGVALVGLVLTAVFINTGSLLLVVILHVVHNILVVFVLPQDGSAPSAPESPVEPGPAAEAGAEIPAPRTVVRPAAPDDAEAR